MTIVYKLYPRGKDLEKTNNDLVAEEVAILRTKDAARTDPLLSLAPSIMDVGDLRGVTLAIRPKTQAHRSKIISALENPDLLKEFKKVVRETAGIVLLLRTPTEQNYMPAPNRSARLIPV